MRVEWKFGGLSGLKHPHQMREFRFMYVNKNGRYTVEVWEWEFLCGF